MYNQLYEQIRACTCMSTLANAQAPRVWEPQETFNRFDWGGLRLFKASFQCG